MTKYETKNKDVAIKNVSFDIIKFIFIGILFFIAVRWFFIIISTIGESSIITHSWADRGFFFFLWVILPLVGIILLSSSKRGNLFKRHPVLAIALGILIVMVIIFNYSPEDIAKADLEGYGYKVLNIELLNNTVYVEIKSLGDLATDKAYIRNYQVHQVLNVLFFDLDENASQYTIRIISEKGECWYNIDGEIYRDYIKSLDDEDYNYTTLSNQINSLIEESERCS